MNSVIELNSALTMSSREIANLLGVRHNDLVRSIKRLIESGVIKGCAPVAYTHRLPTTVGVFLDYHERKLRIEKMVSKRALHLIQAEGV